MFSAIIKSSFKKPNNQLLLYNILLKAKNESNEFSFEFPVQNLSWDLNSGGGGGGFRL